MTDLHITVVEDSELGDDGYAVLRVLGQARHQDTPLRILVSRDGADGCLGPQGWGPRCYGFRPRRVSISGDDLLLRVGPEIVNPVEEYTLVHVRIPPLTGDAQVRWPALQPTADIPSIEIEPDAWESDRFAEPQPEEPVVPSVAPDEVAAVPAAPSAKETASVSTAQDAGPEQPPATSAPPGEPRFRFGPGQPAEPDAHAAPVPEAAKSVSDAAPRRGRTRLWLALLLMILILLIGLAYHFADTWLGRDDSDDVGAPPVVTEEAPADAAVAEEAAGTETDTAVDAAVEPVVPLTADQRLDEARAALQRGDNEAAIRLLRENERAGHAASMTELAQLYDSIGFEPGLFAAPNDSEAVRLYAEACAAGDDSAAAPLATLRDRLTTLAGQGDVGAQTIVRDSGRLPAALAACGL